MSNSVKVQVDTYRRARRIAAREQRTITAVIDRAVAAYDKAAREQKEQK